MPHRSEFVPGSQLDRPGGRLFGRSVAVSVLASALVLTVFASGAVAHGWVRHRGHRVHDVSGTVLKVASPDFTVQRHDSSTETVHTTAATIFTKTIDATVGDAGAGAWLVVKGTKTGPLAVDAARISIEPAPSKGGEGRFWSGRSDRAVVIGKVVSNDPGAGTLVVHTADGDVKVTTDDSTIVTSTTVTDFSALAAGDRVHAKGRWLSDGSLDARRVAIDATTGHAVKAAALAATAETTSTTAPATTTTTAAPRTATSTATVTKAAAVDDAHAMGRITSVSAPAFTLSKGWGSNVVVTTTSGTAFQKTVDAAVSNAAVGNTVKLVGFKDRDGNLVASWIHVYSAAVADEHDGWCDGGRMAMLSGVVTTNDPSTGKLTVKTDGGTRTVKTDASTHVIKTMAASFADVAAGAKAKIKGTRTGDNAITASRVQLDLTTAKPDGFRSRGSRTFQSSGDHDGDHRDWGDSGRRDGRRR